MVCIYLACFLYICSPVYSWFYVMINNWELQTENWTGAVLGFDRVAKVMLACSALYGEHLKENVHILVGENTYALAA